MTQAEELLKEVYKVIQYNMPDGNADYPIGYAMAQQWIFKYGEWLKEQEAQVTKPKYPVGGYAPGNYDCTCATCKCEFVGDKLAVQCEPCAIKATTVTPVTWEQACDSVCFKYNFRNWDEVLGEYNNARESIKKIVWEAAHLFMEANRQQRWIPVEERLPEEDVEVTVVIEHVTCKDRHVRTMRLAPDMFQCWIFYDNSVLGSIYKVILWQPLPEIPKEVKG